MKETKNEDLETTKKKEGFTPPDLDPQIRAKP